MANLEELVVSLVAETSGLRAELANATKVTKQASEKMDDSIKAFSENSSKNLSFFETSMASMVGFLGSQAVIGAFNMVKDAASQLFQSMVVDGVRAAQVQEDALNRLTSQMALAGNYSTEAAKDMQDFAASLQATTKHGDEAILSQLALAQTFGRSNEETKRLVQAATELSAATGMSLESAVKNLGKAYSGLTGELGESLPAIKALSAEQLKAGGAVDLLLNRFGGSAASQVSTFSGVVAQLGNQWGDLTEQIGNAIIQNPVVISTLKVISEVLAEITGSAKDSGTAFKEVLARSILFAAEAIGTLALMADPVFRALKLGVQSFVAGLNTIAGTISYLGDALGIIEDNDPFQRLKVTADAMNDTVGGESNLGKLAQVMADIKVKGEEAFTKIGESAEAAKPPIDNQIQAVKALSDAQTELLKSYAAGLADQGSALDAQFQYENQLRQTQLEIELASLQQHNENKWALLEEDIAYQREMMALKHEEEWTNLEAARANNLITEEKYRAAQTALARQQYLETKKIEADKTKLEAAEQQARMQGYGTFLDGIAAFSQSGNKKIANIAKAAAITKTTIDAYVAIQNALANVPFPANIAAAAGIGAMAFANVAKIAGIGLNQGGTIAGGGANMDTVPASLTKGETVVTRDLTNQLADFLNGQQGGGGSQNVTVEIRLQDNLVEFIEAKILERQANGISLLNAAVV